MATIKLDVVTAEKVVYSDDVDIVIAPGIEGQLGILPQHSPLMTMLQPGELIARKGSEEFSLVVSGGFLEVRPDRVIVLADSAERTEEIDIAHGVRSPDSVPGEPEEVVNTVGIVVPPSVVCDVKGHHDLLEYPVVGHRNVPCLDLICRRGDK